MGRRAGATWRGGLLGGQSSRAIRGGSSDVCRITAHIGGRGEREGGKDEVYSLGLGGVLLALKGYVGVISTANDVAHE